MRDSELPRGWIGTTVAGLFEVIGGGTPSTAVPDYWAGNIPWISSADIDELHHMDLRRFITDSAIRDSATNLVPAGAVIVVTRVGLGKVAIAPTAMCFSQDSQALIFEAKHLHPNYVLLYMSTAVGVFKHISRGTTISGVTKKQLAELRFLLPPRKEQERIVSEIETLLTDLDAAVVALKRAQVNLKRYRASVLKAACEGRLVPTEAALARKERRSYETGEQLLARILKERRAKWESDHLAKMLAAGKPPKNDDWKKKYKTPEPPDTTKLPELPEGWMWASMVQVFQVHVGATPSRAKPEYWNGTIPWVSSGEVGFCRIHQTHEYITDAGLANASTTVHPQGTVLLGMIGEGKTRGQVAILDVSACNNQNSAAIRVSESGLPPEFVYRYLEGRYEQTRSIGSGNNQPALNKARVEQIPIPLPPLAEQQRIVDQLESKLSFVDSIENGLPNVLKRADRLRQSILKRAFEGKLVPQDLNDEPASALLERIRAERATKIKDNGNGNGRSPQRGRKVVAHGVSRGKDKKTKTSPQRGRKNVVHA